MSVSDIDGSIPAERIPAYNTDSQVDQRRRWQSLLLLSSLMFVVISNGTGITVALPSIKSQLDLTDADFVWVTNAYTVTYAGTLLLSGRLGDFFGHRRVFYWGIGAFTLASLGCAISSSAWTLIAARALQGVGGAAISTSTFSLLIKIFTPAGERTKAIGIYTFFCCMGGILGFVLSGILVGVASWRCLFFLNIAIGLLACARRSLLSKETENREHHGGLDVWGAITSMISVGLILRAVLNVAQTGWLSLSTLYAFLWVIIALAFLIKVETQAPTPVIPLSVFRIRGLLLCCIINVLYSIAAPGGILISLYFQRVLGHTALWGGFAYIPAPIISAIVSLKLLVKVIQRFGIKFSLILGLCACAGGFLLFARAPVDAHFATDVLPGLILIGISAGITYSSLSLVATSCLSRNEAGLVSGLITTSSTMGSALGFAILITVAATRTRSISTLGVSEVSAINAGYHVAFLVSATMAGLGILPTLFGFPRTAREKLSGA